MKKFHKILKTSAIYLIIICASSLLIAILNYFNIISSNAITIIDTIIMVVIFAVLGFINGKKAEKKGYLTGLKVGGLLSLILLIFSFILFKSDIRFSSFIYYLILIVSCIFGSMLGINKKSDPK